MNYGELKEDEYYVGEWDKKRVIFIHSKYKETPGINSDDVFKFTEKWCSGGNINFRTPTLEEKHWLDVCIKADKFIPLEEAITEFKQGDYIVCLEKPNGNTTYIKPFCIFEQYKDDKGLYAKISFDRCPTSCTDVQFDKKSTWRYATKEEISHYKEINKPYNVTTLEKPKPNMEEIQKECKKRLPIGCTFINPCNNQNYTIEENDIDTYKIIENQCIDGGESKGYLYYKDKYAELIETPEVIVPEYVECLENDNEYTIKNKIYKIDSWKKNNVWGICNIDCDVYKAGKSLCFDNWFENNQKWKHSTKEAYDNQLSKQKPLTPEQCYNTEIKVGDYIQYLNKEFYYTVESDNPVYLFHHSDNTSNAYCKDLKYLNSIKSFKKVNKDIITTKKSEQYNNVVSMENSFNTNIEVGDEVELTSCEKSYYINNYLGQKAIIVKLNSSNTGSENKNTHWVKIKDNGENEHWKIKDLKLIKKANKNTTTTLNKKVDVSSPKVTDKITVPRINTTSYDTLVHINIETNTKSIKIPKLETNTPEIKKIKIQSLTLTI